MTMRKRFVRQLTGWLVVLLLLAQWATASYACPRGGAPGAAAAMADMPDCDMPAGAMDPEQPLLCKAHCGQGTQVVQPGHAAFDLPPAPTLVAVLDWRAQALQPVTPLAGAAAHAPPGPPRPTPIYLALRVLRN